MQTRRSFMKMLGVIVAMPVAMLKGKQSPACPKVYATGGVVNTDNLLSLSPEFTRREVVIPRRKVDIDDDNSKLSHITMSCPKDIDGVGHWYDFVNNKWVKQYDYRVCEKRLGTCAWQNIAVSTVSEYRDGV